MSPEFVVRADPDVLMVSALGEHGRGPAGRP
jgi:hypothetical protein